MVIRGGVKRQMGAQDRVSNCSEARAVKRKVDHRTVDGNRQLAATGRPGTDAVLAEVWG